MRGRRPSPRPARLDRRFGQRRIVSEHAHPKTGGANPRDARADIADANKPERAVEKLLELQLPARRIVAARHRMPCTAGTRRSAASIIATVASATASALPPGTLATTMPRAVAAGMSMLSTPAPCLAITLSRGQASIRPRVDADVPDDHRIGVHERFPLRALRPAAAAPRRRNFPRAAHMPSAWIGCGMKTRGRAHARPESGGTASSPSFFARTEAVILGQA